MLNTKTILDNALSRQHDTSDELRAKALGWLNEAIQLVYLEKDWHWLRKTQSDIVLSDSVAALPDDFGRFTFCHGEDWYLRRDHHLSDEDAFTLEGADNPAGFTLDADAITFYPSTDDETVTLEYRQTLPTYGDNEETVIPNSFLPLLSRATITAVYEYENDQRGLISVQLEQSLLSQLKADDNKSKPIPRKGKYL